MRSWLDLRADLLVHWRSITSPLPPTWMDVYHNINILQPQHPISIRRAALMMPWSLWSPTPPAVRSGSSQRTAAGCQRSGSVRFGRGSAQSRCTERYHHLLLQQQKASDYRESSIQDWLASFIYIYDLNNNTNGFKSNWTGQ